MPVGVSAVQVDPARLMTGGLDRAGARLLRRRWFARAPILLYRWYLGGLFGQRLVLLEHLGRRSGRWRQVCLEVVDRPDPQSYLVVSGFGAHAQWFRNVQAHPECRVGCGWRRPAAARAVILTEAETAEALERYARSHPRTWRRLEGVLSETLGSPSATPPAVMLVVQEQSQRR